MSKSRNFLVFVFLNFLSFSIPPSLFAFLLTYEGIVHDYDGITCLEYGDRIFLINAGTNGRADPPDPVTRGVTGDDTVYNNDRIDNSNCGDFFTGLFEAPSIVTGTYYIRAFNAYDPLNATHWGDSSLFFIPDPYPNLSRHQNFGSWNTNNAFPPTPTPTFTPTRTPTQTPTQRPPNAPTMEELPPYSKGSTNQVRWSDESSSGAYEYFCVFSRYSDFSVPEGQSGWIRQTYYLATGLRDCVHYYFRVKARNIYQLESPWSNVVHTTQDVEAPVALLMELPQTTYGSTFDLQFTASDTCSGFDYTKLWYNKNYEGWNLYPGSYYTSPIRFTATQEGLYAFYTIGYDIAGNREAFSGEEASTMVILETPTPSFTPTDTPTSTNTPYYSPTPTPTQTPTATATPLVPTPPKMNEEPPYTKGISKTVSWSRGDENAVKFWVEYSIDNFNSVSGYAGWISELNYTFLQLTDGQKYYYRVRSQNAVQNSSDWSNIVYSTQDNSPPIAFITKPADGSQTNQRMLKIKGTAEDNASGVDFIELSTNDGVDWIRLPGSAEWDYNWTIPREGAHILKVKATDKLGWTQKEPNIAAINADYTSPSILLGGYWDTSFNSLRGGKISIICLIPDRDIERVSIFYDGLPTDILLKDEGPPTDWVEGDRIYSLIFVAGPAGPLGRLLLEIRAFDRAGNYDSWPFLMVK